ncbi:MAG TPA: P-loop NTPase [Longimicrobiales bacterium]
MVRRIRSYHEVGAAAGGDVLEQVRAQRRRLEERLAQVRRVVAVASGKGGVGKSAVTANLAATLAERGHRVGAVDADLNGPSLARMLGAAGQPLEVREDGVLPATGAAGVRVMSMDLLLADDDAPVRWRGPGGRVAPPGAEDAFVWQSTLETGTLREFLADTHWGELDWLLIDAPPGTDRIERLLGLVPRLDAVLLVTTPSEAARFVVAKSVRLARDAGVAAVGLVANMCAYVCPTCGSAAPLFDADGARRLAEAAALPLWTEIPFDPRLAASTDAGAPFVLGTRDAPAAHALRALADRLERDTSHQEAPP